MTKYVKKLHSLESLGEDNYRLIEMIALLQESIPSRTVPEVIASVLRELVDYTRQHFPREEQMMMLHNYADYEKHKALHQELTRQVSAILIRLKQGKSVSVYEIISFLRRWVDDHLIIEDLKFRRSIECQLLPAMVR